MVYEFINTIVSHSSNECFQCKHATAKVLLILPLCHPLLCTAALWITWRCSPGSRSGVSIIADQLVPWDFVHISLQLKSRGIPIPDLFELWTLLCRRAFFETRLIASGVLMSNHGHKLVSGVVRSSSSLWEFGPSFLDPQNCCWQRRLAGFLCFGPMHQPGGAIRTTGGLVSGQTCPAQPFGGTQRFTKRNFALGWCQDMDHLQETNFGSKHSQEKVEIAKHRSGYKKFSCATS